MKHKITHRIRGHDYSVSYGGFYIVYTSGASKCNISYVFEKMLKYELTNAEYKTLQSMMKCYGIGCAELFNMMKGPLDQKWVTINPPWQHMWKCNINKRKILKYMGISKTIMAELEKLEPYSKNYVRFEIEEYINEKYRNALDTSKTIRELRQNIVAASNDITAEARKRHENEMRRKYSRELKNMLEVERHKEEVKA